MSNPFQFLRLWTQENIEGGGPKRQAAEFSVCVCKVKSRKHMWSDCFCALLVIGKITIPHTHTHTHIHTHTHSHLPKRVFVMIYPVLSSSYTFSKFSLRWQNHATTFNVVNKFANPRHFRSPLAKKSYVQQVCNLNEEVRKGSRKVRKAWKKFKMLGKSSKKVDKNVKEIRNHWQ